MATRKKAVAAAGGAVIEVEESPLAGLLADKPVAKLLERQIPSMGEKLQIHAHTNNIRANSGRDLRSQLPAILVVRPGPYLWIAVYGVCVTGAQTFIQDPHGSAAGASMWVETEAPVEVRLTADGPWVALTASLRWGEPVYAGCGGPARWG